MMVAAFFGLVDHVERQRVADAARAFTPLEGRGVVILSQPIALERYCRYVIEFSEPSGLADDNIARLTSLNSLPSRNTLDVVIRTPRVTDQGLPVLLSIETFDLLDVTETSISDGGIIQLRKRFPKCIIPERKLSTVLWNGAAGAASRSPREPFAL